MPLVGPRPEPFRAPGFRVPRSRCASPIPHGSRDPVGQTISCAFLLRACLQDALDSSHNLLPLSSLMCQLLASAACEPVEPCAPLIIGCAPLGGDQPGSLQSLEGWIKRTVIHEKQVF